MMFFGKTGKENNMRKVISAVLALIFLFAVLCGCSGTKTGDTIFGTVTITGPAGEVILDSELYVDKDGATAADAIKAACAEVRLSYTYENGMFDNFNGIASGKEDGWLFYSDGVLSEVGAGECPIKDAFEIEFKYVNYAESFNLN